MQKGHHVGAFSSAPRPPPHPRGPGRRCLLQEAGAEASGWATGPFDAGGGGGGPPGLQGLQAHGETQADRPGARQPLSGAWLDLGLDSGPWKPCMSTRETRPRVPEAPAPPPPEGGMDTCEGAPTCSFPRRPYKTSPRPEHPSTCIRR
nr:uncharacterized protein LOC103346443 [Oryctolagus cuniculus]